MLDWPEIARITAIIVGTATILWWLFVQFSTVRHLIYDEIKKLQDTILDKLEYHERHDDTRFAQLINDIWALRLQNAQYGMKDKTVAQERIKRSSEET